MSADVHLCVPVLRRYDLLADLLRSLVVSTVIPNEVHIIDNGQSHRLEEALKFLPIGVRLDLFIPRVPMGVAQSWNWFIANVPEERLIVNDDVTFAPDSIAKLIAERGDMVSGLPPFVSGTRGHAFSCFLIRNSCIEQIGLFDEMISPGYAYFEDCDYEQRMYDAGLMITHVDCGIRHVHSATLATATTAEVAQHHQKFLAAQRNYINKWGRLPRGVEQA